MSGTRCAERIVAALIVATATVLASTIPVLGAEPSPTSLGGDPRSAGEGPGLVGEPLLAIGAVVAIALIAALATALYVRVTTGADAADGRPRTRPRDR